MCGIAGVLNCPSQIAMRATRRMVDAMRHRGPDGARVELVHEDANGAGVALGAARLAILDLSSNGDQPMRDHETRRTVVHNGEVYNVAALRAELQALGQRFASTGDTEVVLRAFNAWGEQCVQRFRGMFATAVWDDASRQVFVFRDRLGIKPLYYASGRNGALLFASEIRALLASGLVDSTADAVAFDSFLAFGSVRAPRTVLAAAKMLMPAHTLVLSQRGIGHSRRYWDLSACPVDRDFDENAEIKVRDRLLDALEAHLVSDVSIGLFLSGGIDSATLAALTARIATERLQTFSLAFDNVLYDERTYASSVAERWHTEHHERTIGQESAFELVESALAAMDQPSIDGFNSFAVSRFARTQGLKVALSGLGGDEVFGGYATFSRVPMMQRIGKVATRTPGMATLLDSIGGRIRGERGDTRLSRVLRASSTAGRVVAAYHLSRELFPPMTRATLFGQDYSDSYAGDDDEIERRIKSLDSFRQVSLLETELYMANMLLRDTDVMGMANSLEIRVPLLDHLLVEHVWAFPTSVKAAGRRRKGLLIGAMRQDLPQDLVKRPKKGFTLPWPEWIASVLQSELHSTFQDLGSLQGVLDTTALRKTTADMLRARDARSWSRVWALYVAARWFRRLKQMESTAPAMA